MTITIPQKLMSESDGFVFFAKFDELTNFVKCVVIESTDFNHRYYIELAKIDVV